MRRLNIGTSYAENGRKIDHELELVVETIVAVLQQIVESDPQSAPSRSLAQPINGGTKLDSSGMTQQYWHDFIDQLTASPDFESLQLQLPPGQSFHGLTVRMLAGFVTRPTNQSDSRH
jgi:hypothetical protein